MLALAWCVEYHAAISDSLRRCLALDLSRAVEPKFLGFAGLLLRKEVIQPQVPLRLPCYDFIPVIEHTLGASLPCGLGWATSGASNFHDVTGGVYKARERIQGVVADTPLLAIPASWSRVADSNLNWGRFSGLAPPRGVAAHCTGHCSTCAALDVRAILT